MRRRLLVRAFTLLLALLLPLEGGRVLSSLCVDGSDCDAPCCKRDPDERPTLLPVLPCCRTVAFDQAPAHPTPTVVQDASATVATPAPSTPVILLATATARFLLPAPRHLPAPPLYHRHCSLLL